MSRTEEFINQCLKDVPQGKYRRRTEKELRDHLECLRGGSTEAEVLRLMGDPERLRKEFYIAWKQTPLCRANWIISGGFVIWGLICLSMALLVCVSDLSACLNMPESLISTELTVVIISFAVPFPLGALFLRTCFREERHRVWWVTLGLLPAWASFHWFLVTMTIAFEEIDQYWEQALWLSELQRRFPWLMAYLWLSFFGCLVLGWLFGRKTERRRELA